MKCINCKKKGVIKAEPARHLTSPNRAGFKLYFCSKDCLKTYNKEAEKFWLMLDRNASDSACFVHDHWEKDDLHRGIRVGKCNITGEVVRVEPLQPGDNSGQPKKCYEHFQLR